MLLSTHWFHCQLGLTFLCNGLQIGKCHNCLFFHVVCPLFLLSTHPHDSCIKWEEELIKHIVCGILRNQMIVKLLMLYVFKCIYYIFLLSHYVYNKLHFVQPFPRPIICSQWLYSSIILIQVPNLYTSTYRIALCVFLLYIGSSEIFGLVVTFFAFAVRSMHGNMVC